jgi:hypothetical protein
MFGISIVSGQVAGRYSIKGTLLEQKSLKGVSFATVVLRASADSALITGTSGNIDGEFRIEPIPAGKYYLVISAIGYDRKIVSLELSHDYDAGRILISERSLALGEVVVLGDRIKAKTGPDKTTYFINKKISDASDNGTDVLSYIPGVQVDIMKNISLEGNQHILILVDGKERDRNFLSQLRASQLDKVEIINSPGSKYDADVNGVINIILKKEKTSGLDGHVHLEVPTSNSEIYVFPDYSLNYSFRKLNFYTSYDGELSYFNITESCYRNFQNTNELTEIRSSQTVRQKYWSHRFHLGFDYNFNEQNQLSVYAFYNPYSSEHSGVAMLHANGDLLGDQNWSALKHDEDINHSRFITLNYKHHFKNPLREITFDMSFFNFNAVNSIAYITGESTYDNYNAAQINTVKPLQNSLNFKADYSTPLAEKLKLDAGIKVKTQTMKDRQSSQFNYNESIFSMYGALSYSTSGFTLNAGLRAENSTSGMVDGFHSKIFALLPDAGINFKINSKENIKVSYNRTITRPNIYELNPYSSSDDPYSVQSGNPSLEPEYQQNLSIDYSKNIENNYISLKLYYLHRSDAINNYTFINNDGIFDTRIANLGSINGYGFQMTGALKIHSAIAINPFLKLTGIYTEANDLARQYNINSRHKMAFESGFSAIVTFKYDIVASLKFQYSSPLIQIQTVSFSDALYILSLEKSIGGKFKIGISSALTFAGKFTYHGSETRGTDFYSYSKGEIRLSAVPLWLKFTYQFDSGKSAKQSHGNKEDIENMPKKGF